MGLTSSCLADDGVDDRKTNISLKYPSMDQGRPSIRSGPQGSFGPTAVSADDSLLTPDKEMVLSEERYFEQLKTLQHEFLVPLFEDGILPRSKQPLFTQDIRMIYNFHKVFLKELQDCTNIPGLFVKRADFFKIYVRYVENYTQMLDCIAECRENPQYKKFTNEMKEKRLFLESLLIAPIQRVPRYELLLKEMMKSSEKDSEDHFTLSKARDKVHSVAVVLNERKREFEKLARMSYLASRIHGLPESTVLYDNHRKFLDEQIMKRRSKYDDSKLHSCHVLLFSDILITTDNTYKFKRLVPLNEISKGQVVDEFNGLIFRVEKDKDLILYCADLETSNHWMEKVLLARDRVQKLTKSRTSLMTKLTPKNPDDIKGSAGQTVHPLLIEKEGAGVQGLATNKDDMSDGERTRKSKYSVSGVPSLDDYDI